MENNEVALSDTSEHTGKKLYKKPEIIHEMLLETRAGSLIPGFVPPWESEDSWH